jgi:hypothetical protein
VRDGKNMGLFVCMYINLTSLLLCNITNAFVRTMQKRKTGHVCIKVILGHIHITIVVLEKQYVLNNMKVCL